MLLDQITWVPKSSLHCEMKADDCLLQTADALNKLPCDKCAVSPRHWNAPRNLHRGCGGTRAPLAPSWSISASRDLKGHKLWTYFEKKSQSNTIELNRRYWKRLAEFISSIIQYDSATCLYLQWYSRAVYTHTRKWYDMSTSLIFLDNGLISHLWDKITHCRSNA